MFYEKSETTSFLCVVPPPYFPALLSMWFRSSLS